MYDEDDFDSDSSEEEYADFGKKRRSAVLEFLQVSISCTSQFHVERNEGNRMRHILFWSNQGAISIRNLESRASMLKRFSVLPSLPRTCAQFATKKILKPLLLNNGIFFRLQL